ncbi:NmrA family NAD(P)-binding protein [Cupriavidus basilensis]|uniref:NmrA family NAD(P)-binding protein n=1 Tax=Cupriavidus basilensis TaxID=68895 RepID=A0A643FS20_9BURK|nr:NmrA family NAD(P)-binding protein [Cupriavidus basilensis]QOT77845.1 NmrA family NAD(P)-binding protein [Cupriavidus basilensis]
MTTHSGHDSPILVTGAAGTVGAIGRSVTEMLLARGHKVRAMVRREDARVREGARSGIHTARDDGLKEALHPKSLASSPPKQGIPE